MLQRIWARFPGGKLGSSSAASPNFCDMLARVRIAIAIVTAVSACDAPTEVVMHVSASVRLQTLTGRVITHDGTEYSTVNTLAR